MAFPSQMHALSRSSLLRGAEKGEFADFAERRNHLQGVFAVQAAGGHKLRLSKVRAQSLYVVCHQEQVEMSRMRR
jgi:hypothetical protein